MIQVGRLRTALLVAGASAFAACSGTVQENLGIGKRQPD